MRTLAHGQINRESADSGFVLLRDLLVLFIVIVCMAAAFVSLMVFSHQGDRMLRSIEQAIVERNEITRNLERK